jgi:hypothetical protein
MQSNSNCSVIKFSLLLSDAFFPRQRRFSYHGFLLPIEDDVIANRASLCVSTYLLQPAILWILLRTNRSQINSNLTFVYVTGVDSSIVTRRNREFTRVGGNLELFRSCIAPSPKHLQSIPTTVDQPIPQAGPEQDCRSDRQGRAAPASCRRAEQGRGRTCGSRRPSRDFR